MEADIEQDYVNKLFKEYPAIVKHFCKDDIDSLSTLRSLLKTAYLEGYQKGNKTNR